MFKKTNPLRIILTVLLIAIPLYPKFPLIGVANTYVAIRLDDILILSSILVLFIHQIFNRFNLIKHFSLKLIVPYFIAIIISFINAYLIFQTDKTNLLILHLLRRFEYISLFFVALPAITSLKDVKHYYLISLITSIGVSLYGYGQKYLSFPVISTMNEEFSKGQLLQMNIWTRISSTFAGHYDLAAYLSVLLVLISGGIILTKNIFSKIIQILIWLNLFNILTLTASRVSIFSFFIATLFMLILVRKYLYIFPLVIIFSFSIFNSKDLNQRLLATLPAIKKQFITQPQTKPTLIPTIAPIITTAPISPVNQPITQLPTLIPTPIRHPSIEEQIPIDADSGVARSGEIRFNVEWPRAITAFRKNPITGTGLGSISLATDNDYLRLLGESGIVGTTTFLIIFFYFFIKTIPSYKKQRLLNLVFFSAMFAMLLNATLIDVFESSKVAYLFWIMMAAYYQNLHDYHS